MDRQQNILPVSQTFEIVAIAASAGGLNALSELLAALPETFPCKIVVVQHLSPDHFSHLSEILARRVHLPIKQAEQGEQLRPRHIYTAPPGYHLLVNGQGTVSLTCTEEINFVRPSADVFLDSVAATYGKRAIAIILTGTGKDGAEGIQSIHQSGGLVIVQDPETAEFEGMPDSAIATEIVDFVIPLADIAQKLIDLVTQEPSK
ncbi:MAG: chemotaxis protein CheB [Snowella sp.]|nr:chemotaxis protein CheB [Snowella sp.]